MTRCKTVSNPWFVLARLCFGTQSAGTLVTLRMASNQSDCGTRSNTGATLCTTPGQSGSPHGPRLVRVDLLSSATRGSVVHSVQAHSARPTSAGLESWDRCSFRICFRSRLIVLALIQTGVVRPSQPVTRNAGALAEISRPSSVTSFAVVLQNRS